MTPKALNEQSVSHELGVRWEQTYTIASFKAPAAAATAFGCLALRPTSISRYIEIFRSQHVGTTVDTYYNAFAGVLYFDVV